MAKESSSFKTSKWDGSRCSVKEETGQDSQPRQPKAQPRTGAFNKPSQETNPGAAASRPLVSLAEPFWLRPAMPPAEGSPAPPLVPDRLFWANIPLAWPSGDTAAAARSPLPLLPHSSRPDSISLKHLHFCSHSWPHEGHRTAQDGGIRGQEDTTRLRGQRQPWLLLKQLAKSAPVQQCTCSYHASSTMPSQRIQPQRQQHSLTSPPAPSAGPCASPIPLSLLLCATSLFVLFDSVLTRHFLCGISTSPACLPPPPNYRNC